MTGLIEYQLNKTEFFIKEASSIFMSQNVGVTMLNLNIVIQGEEKKMECRARSSTIQGNEGTNNTGFYVKIER